MHYKQIIRLYMPAIIFLSTIITIQAQEAKDNFWSHKYYMTPNIPYGTDSQQKLDAYIQGEFIGEPYYFKPNDAPSPTLIYYHGGGWISGEKETRAGIFLHYLQKGWNVINVEYRLGKSTAPNAVEDALMAYNFVIEQSEKLNIDINNIVISGESAGGHLALITGLMNSIPNSHPLVKHDNKIKAIVNWFGAIDLASLNDYYKDKALNFITEWIDDDSTISQVSKKYSPIHYITKNSPPILSIHGISDTVVPYTQAEILHEKLKESNVTEKLLLLENGKHMGFTNKQFQLIQSTIFSFLDKL